jgi:hypothetical protein
MADVSAGVVPCEGDTETPSPGETGGIEVNARAGSSTVRNPRTETKSGAGEGEDAAGHQAEKKGARREKKTEIIFKLGRERTEFSSDEFPPGVTTVNCNGCEKLKVMPKHWPSSVRSINLRYCISLTSLPDHWPSFVTTINLRDCQSLVTLPEHWPSLATSINLHYCINLTELPKHWPPAMTTINLHNCCKHFTMLPENWPPLVTEIHLYKCFSLTTLPGIPPAALKVINTEDCHALPASVRNLGEFEVKSPADRHHVAAVLLAAHLQRSITELPVIEEFLESFLNDDFITTDEQQSPMLPCDDGERKGGSKDSTAHTETTFFVVEDGGGDGEKGGRFVTCSTFNEFVGGSFIVPVWPVTATTKDLKEARTDVPSTLDFSKKRQMLDLAIEQKLQVEEAKARMLAAPEGSEERRLLELAYKQTMQDVTVGDEQMILDKNQITLADSSSRSNTSSGNARLQRLTRITHLTNPAHGFLGALLALPPWVQARLFQSEVSFIVVGLPSRTWYYCSTT